MWEKSWIVVGDVGGDPIIAHVDKVETPISTARHGIGNWELKLIAPSLASFLEFLETWIEFIIVRHKDKSDLLDEECNLSKRAYNEILQHVTNLTTEPYKDNLLLLIGAI